MIALALFAFTACSKDDVKPNGGGGGNGKPLALAGGVTEQEQIFYKDEIIEDEPGFAFYAPASWRVSVSGANKRAVSWVTVKSNGVKATMGPKGHHALTIEVQPNDTDETRSAMIRIDCGNSNITVTVTQDRRTIAEAGDDYRPRPGIPADPTLRGIPPAGSRLVSKISYHNNNNDVSMAFEYNKSVLYYQRGGVSLF